MFGGACGELNRENCTDLGEIPSLVASPEIPRSKTEYQTAIFNGISNLDDPTMALQFVLIAIDFSSVCHCEEQAIRVNASRFVINFGESLGFVFVLVPRVSDPFLSTVKYNSRVTLGKLCFCE